MEETCGHCGELDCPLYDISDWLGTGRHLEECQAAWDRQLPKYQEIMKVLLTQHPELVPDGENLTRQFQNIHSLAYYEGRKYPVVPKVFLEDI